ncbi:hypothetical protein AXW67_33395 [Bradyrhizobium neotropicale]|uniref:Uncharacterized protein n=1 Tax=Bradyrhizobium neotropicale TaxID=1497615 RepID=A0A176ZHK3_9BRAD|nr:hypothetical protein AXW67_33395 [Bradyrhizobium neotropicale]
MLCDGERLRVGLMLIEALWLAPKPLEGSAKPLETRPVLADHQAADARLFQSTRLVIFGGPQLAVISFGIRSRCPEARVWPIEPKEPR